jgi:teichuronic acid biosynthesis glycosyltransferase TuaC
MRTLTVSHLYPNPAQPLLGVFVEQLAMALGRQSRHAVVAGLPHMPLLRPAPRLPLRSSEGGLAVFRPRYLALPSLLLKQRWRPYLAALQTAAKGFEALPEVAHAHWLFPDAYAVARWARPLGIPSVVTIHGHASIGLGIKGVQTVRHREALAALDGIVAVSDELRELLKGEFGVPNEKIRVIHNGVEAKCFRPGSQEEARRELGLPLNRPLILAVARLSPEKKLERLIDAAALCSTRGLRFSIVGEGPMEEELRGKIALREMQGRVTLEGGVMHGKLPLWYQAADVVALVSAHEGCPVVVQEALACGTPVVSTRVGAVPDLVRAGENGLLCAPEAEALAAAIDAALARPWDRGAIAAEGMGHTWDAVAGRTLDFYRELAEAKGGELGRGAWAGR